MVPFVVVQSNAIKIKDIWFNGVWNSNLLSTMILYSLGAFQIWEPGRILVQASTLPRRPIIDS